MKLCRPGLPASICTAFYPLFEANDRQPRIAGGCSSQARRILKVFEGAVGAEMTRRRREPPAWRGGQSKRAGDDLPCCLPIPCWPPPTGITRCAGTSRSADPCGPTGPALRRPADHRSAVQRLRRGASRPPQTGELPVQALPATATTPTRHQADQMIAERHG